MILAIDPGPTESAYVLYDGKLNAFAKVGNLTLLNDLLRNPDGFDNVVIEKIASYGMSVGAEVFETVYWTGRFAEAFEANRFNSRSRAERLERLKVKMHLCHDSRAKDANIRQAIIDRFGGKEKAIGCKKSPGPLYGVSGDAWAALGLAITWWETRGA